MSIFGNRTLVPAGPVRPTHFHEDPNQRTEPDPQVQYATDPESAPDKPEDYGFPEHGETAHLHAAPVFLTEPPPDARQFTDWTSGTITVNSQGSQIGDASRKRRRLVVRNLDALNPVYLSRQPTDIAAASFTLPAGQDHEFFHNNKVYASGGPNSVSVTFEAEYDVDDFDTD